MTTSLSAFLPNPNPNLPNPNLLHNHNFTLSSVRSWKNKTTPSKTPFSVSCSSSSHAYDVVIVGAGVIGLTIARHFLLSSDLSVAIVDKALPCSGATGAGISLTLCARKIFIL